ncbi:unnamed protein product [Hyaloperonospora brassicae]|uniref:Kazal-like domain-containing protein n=1 Tax=Hyaloperonospora brassicae TaxID=162125 RepID=A0AAV0V676_HYABA|nr:unnamed protein product [Hyaloperonospora brassicae]
MKLSIRLVLVATAAIVPSRGTGCPFACTRLLVPVCGSDGRTYASQCQLESMNCNSLVEVTVKFKGVCKDEELESLTRRLSETPHEKSGVPISLPAVCGKACPYNFAPVCGSDGITYGNGCLLEIAQCESGGTVTQTSEGQCPDPSPSSGPSDTFSDYPDLCAETFEPVCGSDGVTHNNSCLLRAIASYVPSLTLAYEGACKTVEGSSAANETTTDSGKDVASCPDVCPAVFDPVCGSDDITYGSECKLEVASCNNPDLHLTKVSNGACPNEQPHQNC